MKRNSKSLKLSSICEIHPLAKPAASIIAQLNYAERLEVYSEESIKLLSSLHPLHVIPSINDNSEYELIAGFRAYQLLLAHTTEDIRINAIVCKDINESDISILANVDIYGSALMHSLGTKSVAQLKNIKAEIGNEAAKLIAPGISSSRAITRHESHK